MNVNGTTWMVDEKAPEVSSYRAERMRKNRLLLSLVAFAACVMILVTISGAFIYYYYNPHARKSALILNPCDQLMCDYGADCRLDEQTNQAYCWCGETCLELSNPVCGDDGITYTSECHLRLSSCTQQREIILSKRGPCVRPDPCESMTCPYGSECSPLPSRRTARCVCPERCMMGEQGGPVCGSDGKNYRNSCELRKASCRENRQIDVQFQGECDPCRGVECPMSQVCQLDEERNPTCRCNSECKPDLRPVCGSDGRTYVSECVLRVEGCKTRRNLRVLETGECSAGMNPCDSLQCGPFQLCDIDVHGTATCHCDMGCEQVVRPVCGTDRETYMNECEMSRQSCLQRRAVKLSYTGECGDRGACFEHPCSYGAICVLVDGAATCQCPVCGGEYAPVCGTDGISYDNACRLRSEACTRQVEIAVADTGVCHGCEKKKCEYYMVCESDGHGNGRCVCPKKCAKVESVVCGSDGQTYQNECQMRLEACHKAEYVGVVSKGPCDLCRDVKCEHGAKCKDGRCVCPTECPPGREEVCANDGITYKNECAMLREACELNQELIMLYQGHCDEPYEGSGSDSVCGKHNCKYGGSCEYESDGSPICVCELECPQSVQPVCGSDGRLYDNSCRLREAACSQQKNLREVHIHMCEEIREIPCNGEKPLFDSVSSKDYFCGEGLGSKRCPKDSYCHKSVAFAKCCPQVILEMPCAGTLQGCCPDGITPRIDGVLCAGECNCNRLGSVGCSADGEQCACKTGVGGERCDRCEHGYWGLHRITEDTSDGCTPCNCNENGSVRDDCEQMNGRCVCKHGIQGLKCDRCPASTVLSSEGCVDESISQPVPLSCELLHCRFGAICLPLDGRLSQCVCRPDCLLDEVSAPFCGSDGRIYGSDCEMQMARCRFQKEIVATQHSACFRGSNKRARKKPAGFLHYLRRKRNKSQRILKRKVRKTQPIISVNPKLSLKGENTESILVKKYSETELLNRKMANPDNMSIEVIFTSVKKDGLLFFFGNESNFFVITMRNKKLELWIRKKAGDIEMKKLFRNIVLQKRHMMTIRSHGQRLYIYLDHKLLQNLNYSIYQQHGKSSFDFSIGVVPSVFENYDAKIKKINSFKFNGCFHVYPMSKPPLNIKGLLPALTNVSPGFANAKYNFEDLFYFDDSLSPTKCLPSDFKDETSYMSLLFSTKYIWSVSDVKDCGFHFSFSTNSSLIPLVSWSVNSSHHEWVYFMVIKQKNLHVLQLADEKIFDTLIQNGVNDEKSHNVTIKLCKKFKVSVDSDFVELKFAAEENSELYTREITLLPRKIPRSIKKHLRANDKLCRCIQSFQMNDFVNITYTFPHMQSLNQSPLPRPT